MTHPQSSWNSLLAHPFSLKTIGLAHPTIFPPHPPPPHINNDRSLNAFTFGSQFFFFISYFFWTVPLVTFLYSNVELLACIASVSVWFRSKERLSTPFFGRSLTLIPRSLLLNRTETLATQAIELYNSHTLFLTAHSFFAYEALLEGGGGLRYLPSLNFKYSCFAFWGVGHVSVGI